MIEFEIALRGYARERVDELVQAVEAAAGDQARIDTLIREADLGFSLRGYDQEQVDRWMATQQSPPSPSNARPNIVLRGFSVPETDALLTTVGAALEQDDPFRRAEALQAIAAAQLPVKWRGYDRGMVDAYLRHAKEKLGG